jgi:ABC-2 type transport system permease protein
MTIVVPILSAVFLMGAVFLGMPEDKNHKILVVDETGVASLGIFQKQYVDLKEKKTAHGNIVDDPDAHLNEKYQFQHYDEVADGKSADDAKIDFMTNDKYKDCDLILYIPSNIFGSNTARLFYKEKPNSIVQTYISLALNESLELAKLNEKSISDSLSNKENALTFQDYQDVKTKINLSVIDYLDQEERDNKTEIKAGIGFAFGLLIYMFIFMYGVQVMKGVIEEKTSRIVEVIVSSVKPFQLMMGKIIGIMLVGLTQLFMWVILITILSTLVIPFVLPDKYSSAFQSNDPTEMIQQTSEVANMDTEQVTATLQDNELLDVLFNETPWGAMILVFIFFFIGGYLLYGSLMAAIGSAVDSETDTQQFMLPVTLPLIFAYIISILGIQDPDSAIMVWCSEIPFTSPIVMIVRFSANGGEGMMWQLLLSMFLLIITFIGTTWIAAKIYRTGILMYGKKVTYKELFKWLKY